MDFRNLNVLSDEAFQELQEAAWTPAPPRSFGDRMGSSVQTIVVCASLAGAVTAASWGWAKAVDWREERSFNRKQRTKRSTS